jgi:hypothetical protein
MSNNKKRTRAHYIHRLSYSAQERLVGTFVLLAVGLLVWLLITSQKTHDLFEEEIILYGTMDTPQGINKETNVIVAGLQIGSVSDINIDDNNHMIVTMTIKKKYHKLIRTNSTAALQNFQFAQLGKTVIDISIGSPDLPVIKEGSTLAINETFNLVQLISRFEPTIMALNDSINKMDKILQVIEPEKITTFLVSFEEIINDLNAITHHISQGQGLAGNMVFDEKMQQDITVSTENLREITEKTISIIEQSEKLLTSIKAQVDEMPEITKKVKPLLDQADKTLKATQQIWPISGNIPKEKRRTLTSPELTE